jgi:hypothetical protein
MQGGKAVRIPPDLLEEIDLLAEIEDRSRESMSRVLLRDGLAVRSRTLLDAKGDDD